MTVSVWEDVGEAHRKLTVELDRRAVAGVGACMERERLPRDHVRFEGPLSTI